MVLSDKIFSPKNFINAIIGKVHRFTEADNDDMITAIHNVLKHYNKEDDCTETLWDYPLSEIDEIVEGNKAVVLVDVSHFENDKYVNEYRWFEVPDTIANPDEFEYYSEYEKLIQDEIQAMDQLDQVYG